MAVSYPLSFQAHVQLLTLFLAQREQVVDGLAQLLNCQKKPLEYQQDKTGLAQQIDACFFSLPSLSPEQALLQDQLEDAHWTSGFKPRANPGNELVNAAELMVRALHMWRQTRWPGQKGRAGFAQTLFNIYLLRSLALLSMRLWDATDGSRRERLAGLQQVLDLVWSSSPADLPILVKDVRWLIPVAISPTTDTLHGYFEIAAQIAESFDEADLTETQKAWVMSGAGHLRAQLRHLAVQQGKAIDEPGLVLLTRKSNALDVALLVQGLVPLLKAYGRAIKNNKEQERLTLAGAICQGISVDPQLFLQRFDLLAPYTMIEYLFIDMAARGQIVYSAMGERHLQVLGEYEALVRQLASHLYADCKHFAPPEGGYSPYGALYGFSSNLLELIALGSLQRDGLTGLSMEDVFTSGTSAKRHWVNSWRNLPHIKPEVVKLFEYPEDFANQIQARIEQALSCYEVHGDAGRAPACGKLFVPEDGRAEMTEMTEGQPPSVDTMPVQDLPLQYVVSSDPQRVNANQAVAMHEQDLLHCRIEGEFLVSYQTDNGWLGISKDLLTEICAEGKSVKIEGLSPSAAAVLRLMCPGLLAGPALT